MATIHNIVQPVVNDAALADLRKVIGEYGASHAAGIRITDGTSSAKVFAFTAMFNASAAGHIFEGQAEALAGDWAASTGEPLTDKSKSAATSKCKVWIIAGKSNYANETMSRMTEIANSDRKMAGRFFEKMTTALRQTKKLGRPLTEQECKAILTGATEDEANPLKELVAALKRVVSGYKAAREAYPDDQALATLEAQAIVNLEVAEAQLANETAQQRVAKLNADAKIVVAQTPVTTVATESVRSEVQIIPAAHVVDTNNGLFATV